EEVEVEDADGGAPALEGRKARDQRLGAPGLRTRRFDAVGIGDGVLEAERVGGGELGVELLERASVDEHHHPLLDGEPQVVTALRADVELPLDLLAEEDLLAAAALDPRMVGLGRAGGLAGPSLGRLRARGVAHALSTRAAPRALCTASARP